MRRDALERLQVLADPLRGLGIELLLAVGGQLAHHPRILVSMLVEMQKLLEHDLVRAQSLVDHPLAVLDALGDFHLALAVE